MSEPRTEIPRVLIVDGDRHHRQALALHLDAAGYETITVEDGEAALRGFTDHAPDVVLLDVLIPFIDGLETCRRLRTLPGGGSVPILFVTGCSDAETRELALAAGGDDFLARPVSGIQLLSRVRALLQRRGRVRARGELSHPLRAHWEAVVRAQRLREEWIRQLGRQLKSPLSAIHANIEYVERNESLSPDERQALSEALGGARALLRILGRLVDLCDGDHETLGPRLDDIDFAAVLDEMRPSVDGETLETVGDHAHAPLQEEAAHH